MEMFTLLDFTRDTQGESEILYIKTRWNLIIMFCRHCEQPECVMSCMSGALKKDEKTGHVQYDAEKCGSCFMCVMNCPYGVLKPDETTHTKVIKCDFCIEKSEEQVV